MTLYEHAQAGRALPFQAEIINSRADYLICDGGVGAGKTRAGLWHVFKRCLLRGGQSILIGAQTYRQVGDVIIRPWQQEFVRHADRWTYKKSDDEITVRSVDGSDSLIMIRSLERMDKISRTVGTTLTGVYLAQAEQLPEEAFQILLDRVRDVSNRDLWFWLFDCNAGSRQHWIYRYLIDPEGDEYLGTDATSVKRIHVKSADNPAAYPPEKLIERRKVLGEALFRLRYEGEWGAAEGSVFGLSEGIQVRDDLPTGGPRWYLAMDHGFNYACQLIYYCEPWTHVIDEVKVSNSRQKIQVSQVRAMLTRARATYGEFEVTGLIGDAAGMLAVDGRMVNANRWFCQELDINPPDHKPIPNLKHRKEGIERLIELFNDTEDGRPLLTISHKCSTLLRSLAAAEWDEKVQDTKPYYDHPVDALRYFVMSRVFRREEAPSV